MRRAGLRAPAGCLLATLLLSSCSPGGGARPSPTPSAATLASADALFFSNRYTEAERVYRQLIRTQPGDAGAHAALALYLNYEQRPAEALTEAASGVRLGPGDGRAQAVLCRAHDWANRIDDAVAACEQALRLAPRDPLAHLFAAEALADHGEVSRSRSEIGAARALITPRSPAYLRAELSREEANLAHDLTDSPGRLAALRAAFAAQPGWAQRAAELMSAQLEGQDVASARATAAAVMPAASAEPLPLEELAGAYLSGSDVGDGQALWSRVLHLAPRDPRALDLNGHLAAAAGHDLDAAERLLQQALEADPRSEVAAGYLLAIGRYLRHDEAHGRRLISQAAAAAGRPAPLDPDAVEAAHAAAALAGVNARRHEVNLPPVTLDTHLMASALAHSYYLVFNSPSPTVQKLGAHRETAGYPGFTGANLLDRDRAAGYENSSVGEDITHQDTADLAIADWTNSVYHRFPILRPDLVSIGYADVTFPGLNQNDLEFGFGSAPPAGSPPVLYPPDGGSGVPTSFGDNELPDPLPPNVLHVSGYPVTATFPPGATVNLSSLTLTGPGGIPLDAYVLPPGQEDENSASLLTKAPLARGTRYTARLAAIVGGRPFDRSWSFLTR